MKRNAIAAVVGTVVLAGCAWPPPSLQQLQGEYQSAVAAGGVRSQPSGPLDRSAGVISVATLSKYPSLDTRAPITVARTVELFAFCHAKIYPLVAMQQAMGFPPDLSADFHVFVFNVSPRNLTPLGRAANWDPNAPNGAGASLYSVRPGGWIDLRTVTVPSEFCSGS